ncbi:YdaS family helix-turn-helix protein [Azospirillum sp. A26]|uniref:transcriptional regulator n=1 Tax=unclassified Azospirillum TaxID=2630922 RepID=UPI000D60F5E2|nr:YdaS family helix-turn-helix protein [Azospirillum sp. TSA6c]PWC54254.1 hypothetical protein TSA6c_00585 [Azospirillum sp. TSA6c]
MTNLTQICRSRGMTLEQLAVAVNRKRDTVKKWGRERRIPAEAVPAVVSALGGAVTAHELRPDVFGEAA